MRKSEAYAKYNNAYRRDVLAGIMPQMAAEIAKPLSSIDKVNIYGTGGVKWYKTGAESARSPEIAAAVMQQVFDTMSEATAWISGIF